MLNIEAVTIANSYISKQLHVNAKIDLLDN